MNSAIKKLLVVSVAAALLMSVWTAAAQASAADVYKACGNDNASLDGFSKADLQAALGNVPADLDDYHGCSARIQAALVAKATKNIPGGSSGSTGKGVKGTRAKLRTATVDDLTDSSDAKKAAASVDKSLDGDSKSPLSDSTDPAITTAPGHTLVSTAAPGTPVALIIGVIGLLLLLGLDLLGRLGKMPRVSKILPWSGQRGGD
ncbi:MAG: hypothetical protein QM648_05550 [Solirubrobacterales bacterium]